MNYQALRPLMVKKFNEYPKQPILFDAVGDPNDTNRFHFYQRGFIDGSEYLQSEVSKVSKTSSCDNVSALQASLALKDIRLIAQEAEIKRLTSLIKQRDEALKFVESCVTVLKTTDDPQKVSLVYAHEVLKHFTPEYFSALRKV